MRFAGNTFWSFEPDLDDAALAAKSSEKVKLHGIIHA